MNDFGDFINVALINQSNNICRNLIKEKFRFFLFGE